MSAANDVSEKKVDLDNVLDRYGIFQRYHVEKMILAFLAFATNTMYCMNFVFAAEKVSYR